MKTRLLVAREVLHTSFWFLPAIMVVGAFVLAFALLSLDRVVASEVQRTLDWGYAGGPEGARSLLSTIAGSMITVAGVVFSITIVALTLASSQFGPRLLRNFIRDRGNQAVLGTFIATYIYCLLVLRTVRGDAEGEFVPSISVLVGVVLAVLSLAVLIYYIHHSATSIQATQVVAAVTQDLLQTIDRVFPDKLGEGDVHNADRPDVLDHFDNGSDVVQINSRHSGYIMAIDMDALLRRAQTADLVICLLRRPGQFTVEGDLIAQAWPRKRAEEDLAQSLQSAFEFDSQRSSLQDVEFGVDQLVEVAVRALSPGINDPFTAMTCVDRLGQALCLLAQREFPSEYRYDEEDHLRVIVYPVLFGDILDEAFDQVRQYGRTSAAVIIRQLEALERIALVVCRPRDIAATRRQAKLVREAGMSGIPSEMDRQDVERRYDAVEAALNELESANAAS